MGMHDASMAKVEFMLKKYTLKTEGLKEYTFKRGQQKTWLKEYKLKMS